MAKASKVADIPNLTDKEVLCQFSAGQRYCPLYRTPDKATAFQSTHLLLCWGGIGAKTPDRRKEITQLELKAVVAATSTGLMSVSLAGFFLPLNQTETNL
jgi:hypothetical protein